MAKISPFTAIRPTRDKTHLVATRPYYTYKENVLKAKMEDNAFAFLHINISDIKHVVHHNMTMPPKSTWVDPKLRSGSTIYNINE